MPDNPRYVVPGNVSLRDPALHAAVARAIQPHVRWGDELQARAVASVALHAIERYPVEPTDSPEAS